MIKNEMTRELFSKKLEARYRYFLLSLQKLATLNIIADLTENSYSTKTIQDINFRLSNDFPECYTTILTDEEISKFATSGTFKSLMREQSVIAMCSILEEYIDSLLEITKLSKNKAASYDQVEQDFNLSGVNNKTLKKIYYIIKEFKPLGHPFQAKQTITLLGEIFAIRNALVHSGGNIIKESSDNAIYDNFKSAGKIILPDNSIDDLIHRILIYMCSLTLIIDNYLETNTSRVE